jgi:hypothetical protein
MLLEDYCAIKRPEFTRLLHRLWFRPFQLHFQFGPRQQWFIFDPAKSCLDKAPLRIRPHSAGSKKIDS